MNRREFEKKPIIFDDPDMRPPVMEVMKKLGNDQVGFVYYQIRTLDVVQHRYAVRCNPIEVTFEKVFLANTYIGKYTVELKCLSFKLSLGVQA